MKLYRGSSPRPIINYVTTDKNGLNWIKIGDMPSTGNRVFFCKERINKEGSKKSRAVYKGDIILSNSMSFGKPYILEIDGFIHDGWFVIRDYQNYIDKSYLCQLLSADVVQNQYKSTAAGGVVKNISSDLVNSVKFHLPSIMEQRKIAKFLELIDQKIEVQIKIISDYNSLKKGIIQHIFNANHEFPNAHLKIVLKEISQKNKNRDNIDVLSVSNSFGFIKQSEHFEDREIASADTSNYKIVNKNEYAYNPARINVGSIARLKNCDCGIVSPMYTIFEIDVSKITYEYFDLFLQSSTFQEQLNQRLEGSVRQCLSFTSMQNIIINLPPLKKQIEISDKMKFIDSKIKVESDCLNLLKTEKDYLLKNMFI